MCMKSPSMPQQATPAPTPEIAAPTYADAKVSKSTIAARSKAAALAGRDIRTSSRGLSDEAPTEKKKVLGE